MTFKLSQKSGQTASNCERKPATAGGLDAMKCPTHCRRLAARQDTHAQVDLDDSSRAGHDPVRDNTLA